MELVKIVVLLIVLYNFFDALFTRRPIYREGEVVRCWKFERDSFSYRKSLVFFNT